ncbi:cytochrome P450 [Streptomyces pluripotens]|uniref:Cytochrome P450 n=1 Tax=Streptomyces pluripotens TaxID=1355015 RepID=A0A221P6M2_9ACTN|nr:MULTISPECIES: cytochrome P450 [Streptomyces]ARP73399.1 cytochrome P450 [Streptomyces pluripotens]ASN27648.1 cytochrome P450 [Streptomyces pluripotens]MCH0561121.1 cytochrome P450 [Streptomyces sp. MUM 16J]
MPNPDGDVATGCPAHAGPGAGPRPWTPGLPEPRPVEQLLLPDGNPVWMITRYEDALAALNNRKLSKNLDNALPELWPSLGYDGRKSILNQHMNLADPPEHTRLRGLVSKAFTPRRVADLGERIQQITDELLDAVAGAGTADLKDEFISPLISTVLYEMLGVPLADRDEFERNTYIFVGLGNSTSPQEVVASVGWFEEYLTDLTAQRRADPGPDLISGLVQANEDGDALADLEIRSTVMLLLLAGAETTINLLSNGILALLRNPEQLAELKNRPETLGPAIEELLRLTSPVFTAVYRFATQDMMLGGARVKAGEHVMISLAAANHDAGQFSDPETLDIRRDASRHLALGHGPHFCIGAPLARLKARIALRTLFDRFDDLQLAVSQEKLTWTPSLVANSLDHLPVTFTPVTPAAEG